MTLQEFEHYFSQTQKHYNDILPAEISLQAIKSALFAFFGIKEPERGEQLEKKIERVATATITSAEMQAYIAAGMPSPFDGWLADYRRKASINDGN